MALFVLWWTFDDHLAAALGTPGLGHLPLWVVALMSLSITLTVNVSHKGWRQARIRDAEF